jgi:lysophospholipase L1-like esterase
VLGVQVPKVSTLAPDVVTILIGVNDIHRRTPPAEYAEHIKTIIQASRATSAKVYVLRLPYIGNSRTAWFPYQWYFAHQTNRYNQVLDQALQNEDVTIIDLYTPTELVGKINSVYYSNDGFHPSDVGYSLWSSVMYDYFNF